VVRQCEKRIGVRRIGGKRTALFPERHFLSLVRRAQTRTDQNVVQANWIATTQIVDQGEHSLAGPSSFFHANARRCTL
jgi:hypothetical protein